MVAKGRQASGERIAKAKLNSAKVQEILALHKLGVRGRGYRALANRYGVDKTTIKKIIRGETWNGEKEKSHE